MGFGRGTERAEVAAEIDERAASAVRDELGGDEVGGVALADPAEVERDAGRERDRAQARVELDGGASRGRCRVAVPGPAPSAVTASKSRSYPAATTAGSTVGS